MVVSSIKKCRGMSRRRFRYGSVGIDRPILSTCESNSSVASFDVVTLIWRRCSGSNLVGILCGDPVAVSSFNDEHNVKISSLDIHV